MFLLRIFVLLVLANLLVSNPFPFDYNAPNEIYDRLFKKNKNSKGYLANLLENQKWTNGIVPYTIDPIYTNDEKTIIFSGMRLIEDSTRLGGRDYVKFVPRTTESSYVQIFNGNGCWSFVGKQANGPQLLSLSSSGCMYPGTVAHELIHALGFFHEQSRPDRDQYVKINWQNIVQGQEKNFEIINEGKTLGLKYDYDSIMHYDRTSFSIDEKLPTIEPLQNGVQLIDKYNQNYLSQTDIQEIRIFYGSDTNINFNSNSLGVEIAKKNTKFLIICLGLIFFMFN